MHTFVVVVVVEKRKRVCVCVCVCAAYLDLLGGVCVSMVCGVCLPVVNVVLSRAADEELQLSGTEHCNVAVRHNLVEALHQRRHLPVNPCMRVRV